MMEEGFVRALQRTLHGGWQKLRSRLKKQIVVLFERVLAISGFVPVNVD
jgi:hypothetical protein